MHLDPNTIHLTHMYFDPNTIQMVGLTNETNPIWRRPGDKQLFTIENGQKLVPYRWRFVRPKWWPVALLRKFFYRPLKAPRLTYFQVQTAGEKAQAVLRALREGPIRLKGGLIYNKANRVVITKAMAKPVIHWMEGVGFVFTKETRGSVVYLDLDVAATQANNVVLPTGKEEGKA